MKKATLIVALMGLMAMVTTASAQLSFSLKAGLNATNMKVVTETLEIKPGYLLGFNAGFGMELGLTDILALEVDALFSRKGCKIENTIPVLNLKTQDVYSMYYVDIPVNLKAYFLTLGSDLRLYAQAGPYVGFGLFGKRKYSTASADNTQEVKNTQDFNWGDTGSDDYRRLDWGIDGGLGLEYDKLSVGVIWWQGLANVAAVQTGKSKTSHHGLSVELGWKF